MYEAKESGRNIEYITTIEFEHLQKCDNSIIQWTGKYNIYRIDGMQVNTLVPGSLVKRVIEW